MIRSGSGDILATPVDVIAHGANCRGIMGAGLAGQIASRWPLVAERDKRAARRGVNTPGGLRIDAWNRPTIAHLFTQDAPGRNAQFGLVSRALVEFRVWLDANESVGTIERVAIPQIGCGIGGLDWRDVRPLLIDNLDGSAHDVMVFESYRKGQPFEEADDAPIDRAVTPPEPWRPRISEVHCHECGVPVDGERCNRCGAPRAIRSVR